MNAGPLLDTLASAIAAKRHRIEGLQAQIPDWDVDDASLIVPRAELGGLYRAAIDALALHIALAAERIADERGAAYGPGDGPETMPRLADLLASGWADGLSRSDIAPRSPAEACCRLATLAWVVTGDEADRRRGLAFGVDVSRERPNRVGHPAYVIAAYVRSSLESHETKWERETDRREGRA